MKYPFVSIIIVNWNGKEFLPACLDSLKKITYKNFEVILVDNGSTDGSAEEAAKHCLKPLVIKNGANLGFAEGNNIGASLAKGKFLLLLNNDTEVKPDFLNHLVETLESSKKNAVVQPKIILTSVWKLQAGGSFLTSSGFLFHLGFFKDPDDPKYNQEMKIFSANGACMLIRKDIIGKVGLFDPDFFAYFEESDFCWRVILAGYNVVYCPKSVILHKGRQTSKRVSYSLTQYLSFKNRLSSILINLSGKEMISMLPLHIIYSGIQAVGFLAMGKFACAWAIPRAFWWNLISLATILQKRELVQTKIRKISDSVLMAKYKKGQEWQSYLLFFYKPWRYKEYKK